MRYRERRGNRLVAGRSVPHAGPVASRAALGVAVAAVASAALVLAAPDARTPATLAWLLVASPRGRSMAGLVGSIAGGALALGGVAWLAATQAGQLPVDPVVAGGLGLAVGGGLGSVVWLLVITEPDDPSDESVTVDMADATPDRPTPEPADLFDASPDPIVFFAADSQGPVVIGVNAAFEEAFGVSGSALSETPLREGALLGEDAEDLANAARDGASFDRVVPCETEAGSRRMRVRLAVTGRPDQSGGYVIYTPADDA